MANCWKCGGLGWYYETEMVPIGGADRGYFSRQVARSCYMVHEKEALPKIGTAQCAGLSNFQSLGIKPVVKEKSKLQEKFETVVGVVIIVMIIIAMA